jgi:hypothetical protein
VRICESRSVWNDGSFSSETPIEQHGEHNEVVCTMYLCCSVSFLNRSR